MQYLCSLIMVLSLVATTVYSNDSENLPELEIHNTFKPENCVRKAKSTDVLTLHYKGTLPDGHVFDSR